MKPPAPPRCSLAPWLGLAAAAWSAELAAGTSAQPPAGARDGVAAAEAGG